MKRLFRHYLVSGKVQGVGFRRFVAKRATENNVTGKVRNLTDGRVEILAQGFEEDINRFEIYVRRGPMSGEVSQVSVQNEIEPIFSEWPDTMKIYDDGSVPWL